MTEREHATDPTPMVLLVLLAVGIAIAGGAGWILGSWGGVTIAVLLAGGILAAGGLLGLLFGIPRALTSDPAADEKASGPKRPSYSANTNLEQVSDWLTKILIGATITQLGALPGLVQQFVSYVGGAFGSSGNAAAFVVALLLLHGSGGFLAGYLWSRLYLGRALRDADQEFSAFRTLLARMRVSAAPATAADAAEPQ